ncbi:MAG: hypothetical protein AAB682_01485 [Patescibacteria group bacterium]
MLKKLEALRDKYVVVLITSNMDSFTRFTVPALSLDFTEKCGVKKFWEAVYLLRLPMEIQRFLIGNRERFFETAVEPFPETGDVFHNYHYGRCREDAFARAEQAKCLVDDGFRP